jgi:glycosyltransferase involved in cell wall biosynthesis
MSSISLIQLAREAGLPVAVTLHDAWHICPRLHCVNGAGFCGGPDSAEKCAACLEGAVPAPGPEIRRKLPEFLRQRRQYVSALFSRCQVMAPSRFLRDLHYKAGAARGQIIHLPLGLDPVGRSLERPLASPPRFVFLGNLVEVKRVDVAVEAMMPLAGEAELLIWGQTFANLTGDFLARIAPHPHIRYCGPYQRENLPEVLAGATATVITSDFENYPLVARESLMLGVPVVASRAGGLPEIVRHEENGLLFPPGDVPALTETLRRLCREPGLLEKLRHGITPVKTITREARELAGLYQRWLGNRGQEDSPPRGRSADSPPGGSMGSLSAHYGEVLVPDLSQREHGLAPQKGAVG